MTAPSPSLSLPNLSPLTTAPEETLEGHTPQGPYRRLSENEKEGYPTIPIQTEDGAGSIGLSTIRLSLRGTEQPHRGSLLEAFPSLGLTEEEKILEQPRVLPQLREHLLLKTKPRTQSPKAVRFNTPPEKLNPEEMWMLQAQDFLTLSLEEQAYRLQEKLDTALQKEELSTISEELEETPATAEELIASIEGQKREFSSPELGRLYIQLHLLTEQQTKTEKVFLQFIKKFPKDVLIWKIFVSFLKKATFNLGKQAKTPRYAPDQIVSLLNEENLKELRKLTWFKLTTEHLQKEPPTPGAGEISITLKKCVWTFQGNLDALSQWILEAEDALTGAMTRTVSPGKAPFSFTISEDQLTPRKSKKLFEGLISQFERAYSHIPSIPQEAHRLCLQLKICLAKGLLSKQDDPKSDAEVKKIKATLAHYLEKYPRDHLALSSILSFAAGPLKDFGCFRRWASRSLALFPYLSWMEKLLDKVHSTENS